MKLPSDAFECYFGLGVRRSYQAVSKRYGVSKTTVAKRAKKEDWQRRVEELEARAREANEQKTVETLESMYARHLKVLRVIQGKALEALKSMSLGSAMEAIRALDLTLKQERLVLVEIGEQPGAPTIEIIMPDWRRHYKERLDRGQVLSAKPQEKKTDNESKGR